MGLVILLAAAAAAADITVAVAVATLKVAAADQVILVVYRVVKPLQVMHLYRTRMEAQ
jgi:hypothetical protein